MTTSHTLAVVFDLDGTLVDTMTSAPQAYADTIRSLGGPDVSPSEVLAVWHIGPTPVVLEHFLGRPISPCDTERFYRFFDAVVANVEPFAGVVDMLDALSRSGHRLGVFTTATHRARRACSRGPVSPDTSRSSSEATR
jgi:phosphoglycolate phosphatase-like HAD superfamily hydrolase